MRYSPTMISRKKKAESMTRRVMILASLERPMLTAAAMSYL